MRNSPGLLDHFMNTLLSKITTFTPSYETTSSVRHLKKIGQTLSKALLNDVEANPAYFGVSAECLLGIMEVIDRHFPSHLGKFLEELGGSGTC